MNKLMKVKPSVAADKLTEYWATYNNQYGVDEYSEKTFLDDALYGIGAVIDKERFRYAQGYDDFKRALYEMLKLEFGESEWISVDDRLPEDGSYVFAYTEFQEYELNNNILESRFSGGKFYWDLFSDLEVEGVTHWMLPKPPAKEV